MWDQSFRAQTLFVTLCLVECLMWNGIKDILESPCPWLPNGAQHLFLGLRVKTWYGMNLIML
jgi:hypothetical protein